MRRRWFEAVVMLAGSAAMACGGGGGGASGKGGTHGGSGGIDILGTGGQGGQDSGGQTGAAGNAPPADCPEAFPVPNPLSTELPRPVSYTDNGDGSVTDNVTGLVWEKAPSPLIACPGSTTEPPGSCTPAQAAAYCTSKGGAWRLPTRLDLMTLVDYDVVAVPPTPTIDASVFPVTNAQVYLTSSPLANDPGQVWSVSFADGYTGLASSAYGRARCVYSKPTACPPVRYQAQSDGSVFDAYTGLTWQQTPSTHVYTFDGAPAGCASPWRLPSPTELQTIVDDTRYDPAIDLDAFPGGTSDGFWTGLAVAGSTNTAWYVSFKTGGSDTTSTTALLRVRCVR